MTSSFVKLLAVAVTLTTCVRIASAEKVMFRDELTGAEMWRLSQYTAWHGYSHAERPFSYEGRRVVSRWRHSKAIVVWDLKDDSERVFGQPSGLHEAPSFVRGKNAVLYRVGRGGGAIYLHDLDTGKERKVVQLPKTFGAFGGDVMGPHSEYVILTGDFNGDGLSDWAVKSLWTNEPTRIIWTDPAMDIWPGGVSPKPPYNRVTVNVDILHPDMIRRAHENAETGKALNSYGHRPDARWRAYVAAVDLKTLKVKKYLARHAMRWGHRAWTGDGEFIHFALHSWRGGADRPTTEIRIGDWKYPCSHYGSCGADGRYIVGDSGGPRVFERLELRDMWTGEAHVVAHISGYPEPPGPVSGQPHPAGSPDGTKAIIHSAYDLVNHRLYAVPTQDIRPGDKTIPVETTQGFAPKGKLSIGCGDARCTRMSVTYASKDARHFYGVDWGKDAEARLMKTFYGHTNQKYLPKGSHFISDAYGRVFDDGTPRPTKEYIVVMRPPAPPTALAARRMPDGRSVRLNWRPSFPRLEIAGYVVFRRVESGALERLTDAPVAGCEFVDATAPEQGKVEYVVRAVEHCGLYGSLSSPAWVRGRDAGVDLVDAYDVRGSCYVEPGKPIVTDSRSVVVYVPAPGDYMLWARGRALDASETAHVSIDGKPLADARIKGVAWHWVKLGPCRLDAGRHAIELARDAAFKVNGKNLVKNPGFEEGLAGWQVQTKGAISVDAAQAHSGGRCVKISGDLTDERIRQVIQLPVRPGWIYRVSYWMRGKIVKGPCDPFYCGGPHSIGRTATDLSPLRIAKGAFRNGNLWNSGKWTHVELIYFSRTDARRVDHMTLTPMSCPRMWGKQEGTLWLDDVEVTELGPRLRPVKVTKLLLTNVVGYVPKGLDGRGAFPFPKATAIRVAGLRITSKTRNSISLTWNPTRAGTRGYNVYLNAGADCPTTKYFQVTSVWGKTQTSLGKLSRATRYTVKVTAINEDGIQGPPATIQAGTATAAAETHVLEAELAAVTPPMRVQKERGVTFVASPADRSRMDELYDLKGTGKPTGAVRFVFTIKQGGQYAIQGRVFAPNGGSNSFWFALDGQAETCWNIPDANSGAWAWCAPIEGKLWTLAPGKHTVVVRTREAGTRLDRLVVTNDLAQGRAGDR